MVKRLLSIGLFAALLSAGVMSGASSAHYLSEDSVDGREIRYEDYTQWDDSRTWAIARWNDMPDGVNVAPDNAGSIADLEVRDYNANDGLCGYWDGRTGADLLALNSRYYSGASTHNRRACTLHEFGHAHRLAHSYSTEVMDPCPVCVTAYTSPQSHDRADYNGIW